MNPSDNKPVIYMIGVAGHPNYGDELIAAAWLRYWARTRPDAEVWLDTPRPGQAAVLLDGLHPGLRCVDTLHHACWNGPKGTAAEILAHGARVVGEPGLIPREATGVENLSRVDLVHLVGGGYLNALWPHHLTLVGAARAMADRYGTQTAITGVGLLPLVDDSQQALGEHLATFDVVDVRDTPSLQAISSLVPQASNSGDDSLLGMQGHVYNRRHSPRTLLCLQSDMLEFPLEELADYVVRTLQAWKVDQNRITLVESMPPNDFAAFQLLQPHLPKLEVMPFSHLWRNGFPISNTQRWITTRFHPHLLAAAAGSWGLAIPISKDYYTPKHESLAAMHSGWSIVTDLGDPVAVQPPVAQPFGGRLAEFEAAKTEVAHAVATLTQQRLGR